MTAIDKAILDTDKVICGNISKFDSSERGLLSQNILSQLRNFVEYIAMKECSTVADVDPNDYDERKKCLKTLKSKGNLKFLYRFHELLQKSASHYTLDENASERLMLKYYEYLLKIKSFLKEKHRLQVLQNINDFPLNTDNDLSEYHKKIAEKIDSYTLKPHILDYHERLYIQKIKPFFVNENIYYEVTFTLAADNVSKFDRVIAFTNLDILGNYAVKLSMHKDIVEVIGNEMQIFIIDSWQVAIRPCELEHFGYIFSGKSEIKSNNIVYDGLMRFMTEVNMNLLELLDSSDEFYRSVKNKITERAKNTALFDIFDSCRSIIKNNFPGSNILRYLLYTMNNSIIKNQIEWNGICQKLSNLHLSYGCKPFDEMPFATSLIQHNPRIFDLLDCIPSNNRDEEFLARYIKTNTEQNDMLFTKQNDLPVFKNIDALINSYNQKLYITHVKSRSIKKYSDSLYINEYADNCSYIITRLKEFSVSGLKGYTEFANSWLQKNPDKIDDEIKKLALLQMFAVSRVAFIYGSAGTGKSTLIRHISELFASRDKLFLANTNPAVDNLKRKVTVSNCNFMTIAKFISQRNSETDCDILFIDECSTVSNSDMRKTLEKVNFKLLVLVGDIYQIEAIQFGNWFSISRQFVSQESVFQLENTFRSSDENLKTVWSRVRNLDDSMQEVIDKFGYSKRLDNSIFEKTDEDEIILCLNYDGLYGINNINSFLQDNNKNKSANYGVKIYKIGDPILFNESKRFSPIFYNNMKGIIRNIYEDEDSITFDIEIDASLNELDCYGYDFQLLENAKDGNSVIRFLVDKKINTETDDFSAAMPFQIAYAVSIHKAQGLEYNSVKIIISDEVEERITHNIFYTAITRARKKLQIYWSPEVEHKVLTNLKKRCNSNRDAHMLKTLYDL